MPDDAEQDEQDLDELDDDDEDEEDDVDEDEEEQDEGSEPHLPEQQPHRPKATEEASAEDWLGSNKDPDVMLSVPDLGIDRINLDVEGIEAHVNLHAKILDIVELRVGAHVAIQKVELDIQNVHAQAMLKVNLDPVVQIVHELVEHPEFLASALSALNGNRGSGEDDFDADDTKMPRMEGRAQGAIEGRVEESHDEVDDEDEDDEEDEEDGDEEDDEGGS